MPSSNALPDERYYVGLAAAFIRGHRPDLEAGTDADTISAGVAAGLRIHKFKRTHLDRVHRVLGTLRGFQPGSLLDIGSGRGAFLWPLLASFPDLRVVAADLRADRCSDIAAVARGGVHRLRIVSMDARQMPFKSASCDVVTMLEVLEHMPDPARAASEALRVARRAIIATVPSHEDDNPEHVQLFSRHSLAALFQNAGARTVRLDAVMNHYIAVATR